jgi:TolA-binding protein
MTPRYAPALLVVTMLAVACASGLREADRSFASGDYLQAAAAYETYLERHPDAADADEALFRLALARVMPGSRVYDRPLAQATLEQLVRRHPASPYRAPAGALLGLLAELDAAEATAARNAEQLGKLAAESAESRRVQEEQIARLRASLADSEAQARQLRDELDRLKSIDLRR